MMRRLIRIAFGSKLTFRFKVRPHVKIGTQSQSTVDDTFKQIPLRILQQDKESIDLYEKQQLLSQLICVDKKEGQILYAQRRSKMRDQCLKVKSFQDYQYLRGEPLLEQIPLQSGSRYLVEDFVQYMRFEQDKMNFRHGLLRNRDEQTVHLNALSDLYNSKKYTYQFDEFQKYLRSYPGSARGPRPEDDMESFVQYGLLKMPQTLLQELKLKSMENKQIQEGQNQEDTEVEQPAITTFSTDSVLVQNRPTNQEVAVMTKVSLDKQFIIQEGVGIQQSTQQKIPMFPKVPFQHYQQYINEWTSWLRFRYHFNVRHANEMLIKALAPTIKRVTKDNTVQFVDLPHNIPSLCRYFQCIPAQLRNHPGLKDIYLGLEYRSPDYPYATKQKGLNWAASQCLPYDKLSHKAMEDFTVTKREYLTPFILNKMFTMDPHYTWDIHDFLDELRRQEARGEISPQEKEEKFVTPPPNHKFWADNPALPVDYYDNDDGFWTQHIEEKYARYDNCTPMLVHRPHLKH